MAIEDDVLVIGGGLAGLTAALSAAEQTDRVRLISYKQSTLRHASGLIDILGYTPGGDLVADPFDALADLPTGHPYTHVGADGIRDGLALFDEATGDSYLGDHTDTNALVPTNGGTVKPTARYPKATAPGLASAPGDTLFVGFDALPDFDGPLTADHLEAAGVPFETRGVTISFPGNLKDDAKVTRYAKILDQDSLVDTGSGVGDTPGREALADVVKPHLEGESRIGFPPVLGDEHADAVRADLENSLGVEVFEVPSGPPSLPGMRLEDMLFDALEEAGVRVTTGIPVIDHNAENGSVDTVTVDRKGQPVPYRADQYVLATGGLVGKGVKSSREGVFEPIFDCHVAHDEDRYEWFVDDVFGDQPYAKFGVAVDNELRPLDADDAVEFSNLRAAGAVLSGYDLGGEKSGSGVSIATGYVAGQRAGTEAN